MSTTSGGTIHAYYMTIWNLYSLAIVEWILLENVVYVLCIVKLVTFLPIIVAYKQKAHKLAQ